MSLAIEIEDEERFQELIDEHEYLGDDIETRVIQLMGLGDKQISEDPYRPIERHDDCLFALEFALKSRLGLSNISQLDLLYACVPVALAQPDEVAKELLEHEGYTLGDR